MAKVENSMPLKMEEERWMKTIDPSAKIQDKNHSNTIEEWEICLDDNSFKLWRNSLKKHCLLLDGVAKGNPTEAGGGGLILDPDGIQIASFAWGLGIDSNNSAEALALWKGLSQALSLNISDLVVFRDSRLIINTFIS